MVSKRIFGFIFGLVLFILFGFILKLENAEPETSITLGIALLMATWWITEVVSLAITSLLPLILFPIFGIMDGKDISTSYINHIIFLFIGGFWMALAMEKWNLHKRIALNILILFGVKPGKILLGFMIATAFLSMWISNTATCMMMIPIVVSVIKQLELQSKEKTKNISIGLLLGIAYSASIGGIATLVGTPPNLSFARIYSIMFPENPEISFSQWMVFAFPLSIVIFLFVFFYLRFIFLKDSKEIDIDKNLIRNQLLELGKAKYEEIVVFIAFISLALLWITRAGFSFGNFRIPGWSEIFNSPSFINDGTVAIAVSFILFFVPSITDKGRRIMDWETAVKIPWEIVLLFGGGFALANGFKESGLSEWFGLQLSWIGTMHPFFIILIISLIMTFLTELTSNTATTEMILPILAGLSVSTNIHPLLLMLPATFAASMAFMLPVATPPNAIIFGTNRLSIAQMAKTGFIINFFAILAISLATYFFSSIVFGY